MTERYHEWQRKAIVLSLRDDFARWREDPMTKTVFGALKLAEAEQRKQWLDASWDGAVVRAPDLERLLIELRTRADAYRSLDEMTFEGMCLWLELDLDEAG